MLLPQKSGDAPSGARACHGPASLPALWFCSFWNIRQWEVDWEPGPWVAREVRTWDSVPLDGRAAMHHVDAVYSPAARLKATWLVHSLGGSRRQLCALVRTGFRACVSRGISSTPGRWAEPAVRCTGPKGCSGPCRVAVDSRNAMGARRSHREAPLSPVPSPRMPPEGTTPSFPSGPHPAAKLRGLFTLRPSA